jgi:hypothetical protein
MEGMATSGREGLTFWVKGYRNAGGMSNFQVRGLLRVWAVQEKLGINYIRFYEVPGKIIHDIGTIFHR